MKGFILIVLLLSFCFLPCFADTNIQLYPGWNFISVPNTLVPGSDNFAIFSNVDTEHHSTWEYDSNNQNWIKQTLNSTLQPFHGYWIYSNSSVIVSLQLENIPLQNLPPRQLATGWNAIGFVGLNQTDARNALLFLNNNWTQVMGYDAQNQQYETQIINGGSNAFSDSRQIIPMKGYWIYMTNPGQLTYPIPTPTPTLTPTQIPTPTSNVSNYSTYSNSEMGVQLDYPSSWVVNETKDTIGLVYNVSFNDPSGQSTQNVIVLDNLALNSTATIQDLNSEFAAIWRNLNYSIDYDYISSLDGVPSVTYYVSQGNVKGEVVFAINNRIIYGIEMNTTNNLFDQYSGIYGHMVNSFKFINRIPSQITVPSFTPYSSSDLNFRMNYPTMWKINETHNSTGKVTGVSFLDPTNRTYQSVTVINLNQTANIYDLIPGLINSWQNAGDTVVSNSSSNLNNIPAETFILTKDNWKVISVVSIKDQKIYLIAMGTSNRIFDQYSILFNNMIQSFQFLT